MQTAVAAFNGSDRLVVITCSVMALRRTSSRFNIASKICYPFPIYSPSACSRFLLGVRWGTFSPIFCRRRLKGVRAISTRKREMAAATVESPRHSPSLGRLHPVILFQHVVDPWLTPAAPSAARGSLPPWGGMAISGQASRSLMLTAIPAADVAIAMGRTCRLVLTWVARAFCSGRPLWEIDAVRQLFVALRSGLVSDDALLDFNASCPLHPRLNAVESGSSSNRAQVAAAAANRVLTSWPQYAAALSRAGGRIISHSIGSTTARRCIRLRSVLDLSLDAWDDRLLCSLQELELIECRGGSASLSRLVEKCPSLQRLSLAGSWPLTESRGGGLMVAAIRTLTELDLSDTKLSDVRDLVSTSPTVAASSPLRVLKLHDTSVTTEGILGLERLANLERLDLHATRVESVSHLSACRSLRRLYLNSSPVTSEGILGLENIPTLQTLDLHSTKVINVRPLATSPSLEALYLSGCSTLNLRELQNLGTLRTLDVQGTRCADHVACLSTSLSLRSLNLAQVASATTEALMGLASIPTLEEVDLQQTAVDDITPFTRCPFLRKLNADYTAVTMAGIAGLESIASLEELGLKGTLVTSASQFSVCCALKVLRLGGSALTAEGTLGLERIATLQELDFSMLQNINDVRHLSSCPALTVLDLTATSITSTGIWGLESLKTLETLTLSKTFVRNVRFLHSLPRLATLTLAQTPLETSGILDLEQLPMLEHLDIQATQVDSVSHFARSRTLRQLRAVNAKLTSEGTRGLERCATLQLLQLERNDAVRDVSHLSTSKSLIEITLHATDVTTPGIAGLERIPTLRYLDLRNTCVDNIDPLLQPPCRHRLTLLVSPLQQRRSAESSSSSRPLRSARQD